MRNLKEIKFPAHYLNSFRLYLKTDPFSSSKTSFDENQCGSENCRRAGRRLADGKKRGCCTPRLPPSLCLCRMQGAPRRDGRLRTPLRAQFLTLSGMGGSGPPPRALSHPGALSLRSRGFGQSNSLPTAGSAGAGLARRNPRQFQIPSRNLPTARLGLLGPTGLLGTPQRSPAASPAILKQGRQVGGHPQHF